jgi:hypothetical protein
MIKLVKAAGCGFFAFEAAVVWYACQAIMTHDRPVWPAARDLRREGIVSAIAGFSVFPLAWLISVGWELDVMRPLKNRILNIWTWLRASGIFWSKDEWWP